MNKLYSLIAIIILSDIAILAAVYYMITTMIAELRNELIQKIINAAFSTAASFEKLETRFKTGPPPAAPSIVVKVDGMEDGKPDYMAAARQQQTKGLRKGSEKKSEKKHFVKKIAKK